MRSRTSFRRSREKPIAWLRPGGVARAGAVNGKAWVNRTLEQNPVPTIWISNSINQIDPAYRRRFQFHLELANPPQRVRENIARKHLAGPRGQRRVHRQGRGTKAW